VSYPTPGFPVHCGTPQACKSKAKSGCFFFHTYLFDTYLDINHIAEVPYPGLGGRDGQHGTYQARTAAAFFLTPWQGPDLIAAPTTAALRAA
jgi:hypothetical protein